MCTDTPLVDVVIGWRGHASPPCRVRRERRRSSHRRWLRCGEARCQRRECCRPVRTIAGKAWRGVARRPTRRDQTRRTVLREDTVTERTERGGEEETRSDTTRRDTTRPAANHKRNGPRRRRQQSSTGGEERTATGVSVRHGQRSVHCKARRAARFFFFFRSGIVTHPARRHPSHKSPNSPRSSVPVVSREFGGCFGAQWLFFD